MSRVVVIGAGVGGLAAAARLAAAGHSVTVCEQADRVGGKLSVFQSGGFRWDTGPSLVTMPHILSATFAATGANVEDHLELQRLDPIARYRFADGTMLDAAADLDQFCARLDEQLLPGSGDDWRALTARAARMWQAVEGPVLRSPGVGVRGLLRQTPRVRDIAAVAPHQSLRALGRRYLRDPRLRMLLDRYATYTGSDPRRAPATLAVIPYVEQRFGGWYVRGGLYRIAEALADVARTNSAVVSTATDVRAVVVRGGRAVGVELADGTGIGADVVVANADAAHVYNDLLPAAAGATARRALRRAAPSLAGFVLLLGVDGGAEARAHHTVLFPSDYDAEFDAIFGAMPRPVVDPTLYVARPDDPAVSPPDAESWFVLVNAPRHGPVSWTDPALVEGYADHVLATLAARGVDLSGRMLQRHVLTPADLQQHTRTVGGAIYGTSSNGMRSAFLRPANASPVPGLYLVGGSAHPGGGLPLVLLSAEIVAGLVGPA